MNIRTAKILGILLLVILATALCGLGLSLGSAESSRDGNHSFADKTGEGDIHRGATALTDAPVVTPTPTPTPFSHPLLFPPVNTNANVSIRMDQACAQILDGACTNLGPY